MIPPDERYPDTTLFYETGTEGSCGGAAAIVTEVTLVGLGLKRARLVEFFWRRDETDGQVLWSTYATDSAQRFKAHIAIPDDDAALHWRLRAQPDEQVSVIGRVWRRPLREPLVEEAEKALKP